MRLGNRSPVRSCTVGSPRCVAAAGVLQDRDGCAWGPSKSIPSVAGCGFTGSRCICRRRSSRFSGHSRQNQPGSSRARSRRIKRRQRTRDRDARGCASASATGSSAERPGEQDPDAVRKPAECAGWIVATGPGTIPRLRRQKAENTGRPPGEERATAALRPPARPKLRDDAECGVRCDVLTGTVLAPGSTRPMTRLTEDRSADAPEPPSGCSSPASRRSQTPVCRHA
jgi:hypothetical protein